MKTTLSFDQIKFLHENEFEIKLQTPFGMQKITDSYEKYSKGKTIVFDDESNFTGADYHLIFKDEEFKPLISLKEGDLIKGESGNVKIITRIEDVNEQKWIDFSLDHSSETYIQSDLIHHNSGKSVLIYAISRYLLEQNKRGMIIVPNVTLIHQLYNDFIDYSSLNRWSTDDFVHKIFAGQDKNSPKELHLSTWQSLMTIKEQSHFEKYDFVIIDEAHGIKGIELAKILEKCKYADYRIGLTGTTDNVKANIKTIVGLTGPINKLITTKTLMDRSEVANLNIKCLVLKYDEEIKKVFARKKIKYQDEIKYLVSNNKRNNFIKNLAFSLNSNTIILSHLVESHGKVLYEMLCNSIHKKDRNIYFIHGGVDSKEREEIRQIMETESNAIIVASVQTMGTGVSIKNLHNIIFATNGKSSIRVLQSIGRVLRLHHSKESATVYDIVDDLSYKKSRNFTLQHFLERVKYYNSEQFNYELKNINFTSEKDD